MGKIATLGVVLLAFVPMTAFADLIGMTAQCAEDSGPNCNLDISSVDAAIDQYSPGPVSEFCAVADSADSYTGLDGICVVSSLAKGRRFYSVFSTEVDQATSIPEPGTLVLLGIGLIGISLAKRKRQA